MKFKHFYFYSKILMAVGLTLILGCDGLPIDPSEVEGEDGDQAFQGGTGTFRQGASQQDVASLLGLWEGQCQSKRHEQIADGYDPYCADEANIDDPKCSLNDFCADPANIDDPTCGAEYDFCADPINLDEPTCMESATAPAATLSLLDHETVCSDPASAEYETDYCANSGAGPAEGTCEGPDCQDGDDGKGDEFKRTEMEFRPKGAVHRETMFGDPGCTQPFITFVLRTNYEIGKELPGSGAREIDFIIAGGEIVFRDQDIVDDINANPDEADFCGITDVVVGEPILFEDVRTACEASETAPTADIAAALTQKADPADPDKEGEGDDGPPGIGEKILEIYKVIGDDLFFGKHQDGKDDTRPEFLQVDPSMKRIGR